jgi:SNF2 family DNA or RNA helicase
MEEYEEVEQEVTKAIRAMNPKHKGYFIGVLDKLNMLRQVVGKGKAEMALPWCEEFLDNSESKLVVYCAHRRTVKYLEKGLYRYGVTTITGETPAKKRYENYTKFQREATPRVILITSAGGEGIDLFGVDGVDSSNILFVERDWNPAKEEQAESRLHRLGQDNAVMAWYLVAQNTMDVKIDRLINKKRRVQGDILGVNEIETSIVPDLTQFIRRN